MPERNNLIIGTIQPIVAGLLFLLPVLPITLLCGGCGTTKWTETPRTATEQLLISDSMDQAVGKLDFRALTGKTVYLDDTYLKGVVDSNYLISSLRQQLLAHGAILKEKKDEADYVLEVRSGAVGTNQHSVLVGIPQVNLPSVASAAGLPNSLPEIPLIKRTKQTAVTKILLYAYNKRTGRPLWQSGTVLASSDARDLWIFGAGPFQKGSIYQGEQFAGERLPIRLPSVPLIDPENAHQPVSLLEEAFYLENRTASTDTDSPTPGEQPEDPADPRITSSQVSNGPTPTQTIPHQFQPPGFSASAPQYQPAFPAASAWPPQSLH